MSKTPNLIIKENDYNKLANLVANVSTKTTEMLEIELDRAEVMQDDHVPNDVVTMNSTVSFKEVDSEQDMTMTLVYPHEANIDENKISVLAPVGAALIGLRVGQVIDWPMPNGTIKKFKVISVKG